MLNALPASPAQPFVRFARVSKTYDGRTKVVDELDLDVREGEFLTLLGPSGSGKTTCLMMLAGFEDADAGDIQVGGRSVSRLPSHKRNIGVVFQNYALFPHMTVAENLTFPLRQRRTSKADTIARVAKALDMVQLGALGGRYPKQLSGGQQQRVALARALVFEPRLVLMDEPLGALDRRLREHMQIEIKQLHDRIGMTAIYVTHDQGEALTMSDRIAVFNRGKIEQIGTPEDIYERPAAVFVAGFVGENNRLPGTVSAITNGICRVALEGGCEIEADAVSALKAGDKVVLSVRPERITIAPNVDAHNIISVMVTDVIYNGDHALVPCRLGVTPILLKTPPAGLRAHDVAKGQSLLIGWHRDAGRAFRVS